MPATLINRNRNLREYIRVFANSLITLNGLRRDPSQISIITIAVEAKVIVAIDW